MRSSIAMEKRSQQSLPRMKVNKSVLNPEEGGKSELFLKQKLAYEWKNIFRSIC